MLGRSACLGAKGGLCYAQAVIPAQQPLPLNRAHAALCNQRSGITCLLRHAYQYCQLSVSSIRCIRNLTFIYDTNAVELIGCSQTAATRLRACGGRSVPEACAGAQGAGMLWSRTPWMLRSGVPSPLPRCRPAASSQLPYPCSPVGTSHLSHSCRHTI